MLLCWDCPGTSRNCRLRIGGWRKIWIMCWAVPLLPVKQKVCAGKSVDVGQGIWAHLKDVGQQDPTKVDTRELLQRWRSKSGKVGMRTFSQESLSDFSSQTCISSIIVPENSKLELVEDLTFHSESSDNCFSVVENWWMWMAYIDFGAN